MTPRRRAGPVYAACKRMERALAYASGDNPGLMDAANDAAAALAKAEGGAA